MNTQRKKSAFKLIVILVIALSAVTADASVIAVLPGAFPGSTIPVTFTGLATGTEVNGLSAGGILFSYSLGNGHVIIDGGPGTTNNITPPNIVATGNPSGVLSLALPGLSTMFGYGYAILSSVTVPNATTINLFNGAVNVGTLSYPGVVDPTFTGGFAGIQSTSAFNRVDITFNAVAAPAFAMDNILFPIPEPSTILLTMSGVAGLLWRARRKG